MRTLIVIFLSFGTLIGSAASYVELQNAEEFNDLIGYANAPVVVAFSASWCSPCQRLRRTLRELGSEYTPEAVVIAYVDADKNKSLRKYLLGGYPTVRSFLAGDLLTHFFVGNKSYEQVKEFVDRVIARPTKTEHPAYCPIPQPVTSN